MTIQQYPIGQQTFSKIIEGGFTYVDKTAFIAKLVKNNGYYFLSRPRRFGKSLLLSTLHAYFDGRKDLFKGLALESLDVDWTPTPVIHIDLNPGLYDREDGLEERLSLILSEYEEKYNIPTLSHLNPASRFNILIRLISEQTDTKIAILVDEYDKPLLGLEENPQIFDKNQSLLKAFYGNLKTMDRYIRFGFLTGVARFNKVSIFSDLNNLYDISLTEEFADICGWTENELVETFTPGIELLANKRKENFTTTLDTLRLYYDGYLFAKEGSRLYNPYSILTALRDKSIEPNWFDTATPTFLANRVKKWGIVMPNLEEQYVDRTELKTVGLTTGSPLGLMFQTGYLTIASYDEDLDLYKLRFPNREVEIGFAKELAPLYIPEAFKSNSPFSLANFKKDLVYGQPDKFMIRLQTLLKEMPYELQNEGNYQSIAWLLCTLCDTAVSAERHSYQGRSDIEVMTSRYIYVFEFKYNESADMAMKQILDRDYAGRLKLESRVVYLIGANFSSESSPKGLTEWIIQKFTS